MSNETEVQLSTTAGEIVVGLRESDSPQTTANFLQHVRDGFYDGTIFHRVIDGFMIQGGGFEPGMRQKATRAPVQNEADNGMRNRKGTVAMARTSDPHSASTQFFINCNDNDFLDFKSADRDGWGYCVFGEVVSGMEVVTHIEEARTTTRAGHRDVPVEDVIIERAQILGD